MKLDLYIVLLDKNGEAFDNRIVKSEATLELVASSLQSDEEVAAYDVLDVSRGYATVNSWKRS